MSNQYLDPNLKIFSLNSNRALAQEIAEKVGVELGECTVSPNSVMVKSRSTSKKAFEVVMFILFNQQLSPSQ